MPSETDTTEVVRRDAERKERKKRRKRRIRLAQQRDAKKLKVQFTTRQRAQVRADIKRLRRMAAMRRSEKLKRFGLSTLRKFRFALPPPAPGMKADRPDAKKEPPNIAATSCLVHGMKAEYVFDALNRGKLSSAFSRVGPLGEYSRTDDRAGGGGTAVYTRAVGTGQDPQAHGYGVGSDPLTCVQFIMSPAILEDPNHVWRASTMDRKGRLPGVLDKQLMKGPMVDPKKVKALWEQQSPADRAQQFNATVTAPPPSDPNAPSSLMNNEQAHYQSLPLENTLKAIVASSSTTFDKLMQMPGAHLDPANPPHGIVMMGDKPIRVLKVTNQTKLLDVLKQENIADKTTGQVR